MEGTNKHKDSYKIPLDILDDLASRFMINTPEERNDIIRTCFNMENAHWFYLDHYCNDEIVPCGIKNFAFQLFQHVPHLSLHVDKLSDILNYFKQYKMAVPTFGAILMNSDLDKVLLVQSYGGKNSWGFPKGKVNQDEDPVRCATREVYEETGYDITKLIKPDIFIERVISFQYTRLYIVQDVPMETVFVPRTRMEIKSCEWFSLEHLPTNKNDTICKLNLGINANSFFMIIPFVKMLKRFLLEQSTSSFEPVQDNQQQKMLNEGIKKRQRHKSLGDLDGIKPLSGVPYTFQPNDLLATNTNSAVSAGLLSNGKRNKVKQSLKRQLFPTDGNGDLSASSQYFFDDNATPQSNGKWKIVGNKTVSNTQSILQPKNSSQKKMLVPIDDFINSDPCIDKWKHFTFDLSKIFTFEMAHRISHKVS